MKFQPWRSSQLAGLLHLALCVLSFAYGAPPAADPARPLTGEVVILPRGIPDPLEPLNRVVWAVNKGVMTRVIRPTSRVYRFIVAKPVRTSVGNFGKNLTYPGRLINNLLQGRWTGARDESYRFACNSTAGIGGLFDVGTRWNIPKSDADFGQTFGQWGWQPHFFLMLPLFGPSSDRDTVGLAADTAANPLLYVSPYEFEAERPLTYLGPYTYFTYVDMYNNLSDTVGEFVRFSQASADPYADIQYAQAFSRSSRAMDLQVKGPADPATRETLEAVLVTYKDPEFLVHGKTRSVLIPTTVRQLQFTYWLQPGAAPMVYIVPGLGAHRLSQPSVALAELAYRNGYSVVSVSSAFHPEFMEHASTVAMPAYLPADGHDMHVALTAIDRRLEALHPGRLGVRALLGHSMGAMHTLFIAATVTNQPSLMRFDRYVAVNNPVRLMAGVARLDEFYQAPLDWPRGERDSNLENTLLKAVALTRGEFTPPSLPFSAIESKFLVGLTFRFMLRDVIYSSQRRSNQAVLLHLLTHFRRAPAYQEIIHYSYGDYLERFVVPYYESRGVAAPAAKTLDSAGDLRTYEAGLRANPDIRLVVNENDFLLGAADLAWLRAMFPPAHLTVFDHGGHSGNLGDPAMQRAILNALADLKTSPRTSN